MHVPNPSIDHSGPENSALQLAKNGYRIFPVHGILDAHCTCGKPACSSPGKHPIEKGWQTAATTDTEVVARWWSAHPRANIGLPTGPSNTGLVVVDVDEGGDATLVALQQEHGALPPTYTVRTGRGRHLYFRTIRTPFPPNSAKRVGVGIDIRGDGGFVLAAGSLHASGARYEVATSTAIAQAPEWLVHLASSPATRPASAEAVPDDGALLEGSRNDELFRRACTLRRGTFTKRAAYAALMAENTARCKPPLGEDEIRNILRSAWKPRPTAGSGETGKARISANDTDLIPIIEQSWTAITAWDTPPTIFRFAGNLHRIERDADARTSLQVFDEQAMRIVLAASATWVRTGSDGEKTVRPPMTVARAAIAWSGGAPLLQRIVACPTYSSSGGLCLAPGYHRAAQLYYDQPAGLAAVAPILSPNPTEVRTARDLLCRDLLGDFPFVERADLANALGLLLLPFVREMVNGQTPLHLIEKPTPGTGASLLAEVITTLALGRPAVGMTEGRDEDEWRKRITAKLAQAPSVVFIDNANVLNSAALAAAITLPTYEDRLLGSSKMLAIAVRSVWLATGNNPELSRELARRTVAIRLDAGCERPWERPSTGFRHENLREWASQNRAALVSAALTLVQAWLEAGKPRGKASLGGMEEWAHVIGGILDVAGVEAFLSNQDRFYRRADREGTTWDAFVEAWWASHGGAPVGVAELFVLVDQADIPVELGTGSERSQRTRLGRAVGRLEGRRFGPLRLERFETRRRAARWRLVNVVNVSNVAGTALDGDGSNGSSQHTSTAFTTFTPES